MYLEKDPEAKEKTAEKSCCGNEESVKDSISRIAVVNIVPCIVREIKCMTKRETALYAEWI
jgi:hypothetical protein